MPGTPASARVGTSGSSGTRAAEVTASARNLPSCTSDMAGKVSTNVVVVWPVNTATTPSLVLR